VPPIARQATRADVEDALDDRHGADYDATEVADAEVAATG
jgi:hypothetical protein